MRQLLASLVTRGRLQATEPAAAPVATSAPAVERRLVYRLQTYRAYPARSDLNPADIPDLWPWCFVVARPDRNQFPKFDFLGESLKIYSNIFLGAERDWISDSTLLDKAIENVSEAFELKRPILIEEELLRFDRRRLLFRAILLPLSDDQTTIDHVLGAANGKLVEATAKQT
jgi:hypothetical protein